MSVAHAQTTETASAAVPPVASSSSTSSSVDSSAVDAPAASPAPTSSTSPAAASGAQVPGTAPAKTGYLHTHGFDLAGSATGRYQANLTDQTPYLAGSTEGVGFLANIREHPVSWFGLELNYGYNKYTEHFREAPAGGRVNYVQLEQHEATAGYVFQFKKRVVQPFIVVGGGGINFRPTRNSAGLGDQWRGAGMYEIGFDYVPKGQSHVGFRLQEHGLFYKAPDFYVANFRSNSWVHQAMPSAGVFYRF